MNHTQEEIEKEIADVMPHGTREVIARGTGIYPKIVDAYFNPFDERKSPHFTVLHMQATLDRDQPEIGEAVWQKLNALRDASRPARFEPVGLSVDHELGELSREFSDVIIAKCEGRPLPTQLREINEAERQLAKYKQAVFDQIGRGKQRTTDNGKRKVV